MCAPVASVQHFAAAPICQRGKIVGMDSLGLYLSVPFCKAKCTFCNFASDAFPPEKMARYVSRLREEIAAAQSTAAREGLKVPSRVDSIFLGGGTPSLLEAAQVKSIF